ncbi:MAG: PEP-CTERM sorting domain-containing protein, partial [Verrucomicrobiota bacterium]
ALTLDGLFFINGLASGSAGLGGTANLVVRAWDVTTGATFAAATTKGSVNVVVTGLGGGTTPPATFGNNSDFKGLKLEASVIPEPSTVALAALGVAGLFVMARRKA